MDNYIWLLNKKNDFSIIWPCVLSLALHFLLLSILVIRPVYPPAGETERIDSIWLYTDLKPLGQTLQIPPAAHNNIPSQSKVEKMIRVSKAVDPVIAKPPAKSDPVAEQKDVTAIEEPQAETKPEQDTESVTEMVIPKSEIEKTLTPKKEIAVKVKQALAKAAVPQPEKPVEKVKIEEDSDLKETVTGAASKEKHLPEIERLRQLVEEKAVASSHVNMSGAAPVDRKVTEKSEPGKNQQERVLVSEAKAEEKSAGIAEKAPLRKVVSAAEPAAGRQKGVEKAPANAASAEKTEKSIVRTAGVKTPIFRLPGTDFSADRFYKARKTVNVAGKTSPPTAGKAEKTGGGENQVVGGSAAKPAETKTVNAPVGQETGDQGKNGPAAEKGIVLPPLYGDLKLEIEGDADLVITVSFTEYLKSRRYRAMTRSEARRVQAVTPVTRKREKRIEAVVGSAGEGVYCFVVESGGGGAVDVGCVLKVYENAVRARTKSLGKKSVSGKTVIAKILMPEGILWDDEPAFSGYMEDSDSITKYNSETGLVWKEYK